MTRKAGLVSTNGTRIALTSVHVEGRLDGLTAEMAITQHYRNDSGDTLEIVYTFPLALGAVLLGMKVSLGGRLLYASIAGKREAWKRYEEAMDGGNAPLLVEQASPGLYTVNLGNINPSEDVSVELRYAQLLHCDNGSLRLTVPTVTAERYGDEHETGGLSAHESVASSIMAEYPLTVRILLDAPLAKADVHCPSHACSFENTANGMVASLNSGALLDRDFILCLDGLEQRSRALSGTDVQGQALMLAGFCPGSFDDKRHSLRLKILEDCSGAMAGDSIEQARQASFGLPGLLDCGDYVSYSRFGSTVSHETGGFIACSPNTVAHLADAIWHSEADMGEADMAGALFSTLNDIPLPEGDQTSPCVLLITHGAIWNVNDVIRTSRATGQRIFAIGVGSSPAESLLHELAQQTGGACALVSPNENIIQTIKDMIGKMRQSAYESPHVDWGDTPVWQTALPLYLYSGKTAYVFASFNNFPLNLPILRWRCDGSEHALPIESSRKVQSKAQGNALTSLAGAARLAAAETPEKARELALEYRLVSEHTSLVLVHEREGEKKGELPVLHQIPQMMAAGHGGFGTAVSSPAQKLSSDGRGAGPVTLAPFSESGRDKAPRKDFIYPHTVSAPVVKVIGVGGCGTYVVRHMVSSGLQGMTFVVANNDAQAMKYSQADHTIMLEIEPYSGRNGNVLRVAEESLVSVKNVIGEAHLVFIVAGMGGSTGSGASPAIANAAAETGALTVGVVTTAIGIEGKKRMKTAEVSLEELRHTVDFLIPVSYERLCQAAPEQAPISAIFAQLDEVMLTAVRCISDALTRRGQVSVDFADVVRLLRGARLATLGIGSASGENRASNAVRQALTNPLLAETPINEACGALIVITASPDLTIKEVNDVNAAFMSEMRENATILINAAIDETITDEVRITFMAVSC